MSDTALRYKGRTKGLEHRINTMESRFCYVVRQIEEEMMIELEKATKQAQKKQRLEKAKAERLKGNPPEDILIEYK